MAKSKFIKSKSSSNKKVRTKQKSNKTVETPNKFVDKGVYGSNTKSSR